MREEVEAKRQPLFDITNDSPITSLTTKETPTNRNVSSVKTGSTDKRTPFSGESLLRCQVQTLLQKVEEEKDGSSVPTANKVCQILQFLFFSELEAKSILVDQRENKKKLGKIQLHNILLYNLISQSQDWLDHVDGNINYLF